MPVECDVALNRIGQEKFHAIDKRVMRHAFDIHNTLGRFCDEKIYQAELAQCCRNSDLEVHREVPLRVVYQDFSKLYYLDLVVEHCVIYELKTVEALIRYHQQQLINYLLLAGLKHGKLINFRAGSVESWFVSTTLDLGARIVDNVDTIRWKGDDKTSRRLKEVLIGLLADWGSFLDLDLYKEAILHFLHEQGGNICPVEIEVNGRMAGRQKMCLLCDGTAWHISALRQGIKTYETHMTRLLCHTRLSRIHWINLNRRSVSLATITK